MVPRQRAIQRVRPEDGQLLRQVRLAALADTPSAFGATLDAEAALTAREWSERAAAGAAGADRATFIAFDGTAPVGLVGGYRITPDRQLAAPVVELVSMWVAPTDRGQGLGQRLVTTVLEWAAASGATTVELWVARGNDGAADLYRRAGFAQTGDHPPLPSDPCRDEIRMRRRCAGPGEQG